jgi:hypothetical protein
MDEIIMEITANAYSCIIRNTKCTNITITKEKVYTIYEHLNLNNHKTVREG